MATALTAWAPEIDPDIPGLPEPALRRAVRNAAIEFCQETLLWTLALDRISIVANDKDYTLTVPVAQYGQIVLVDDVKYKANGADDDQFRTLDPISKISENLNTEGSWQYYEATEPSHFYIEEDANTTLLLYPIPTVASVSGLLVTLTLKPTLAAEVVPDFLYNQHFQTIATGAKSYLFKVKGMPWYDPKEAQRCIFEFRRATNSAKWRKITGATKRPLTVRLRKFV
jgi:hypothetical protein